MRYVTTFALVVLAAATSAGCSAGEPVRDEIAALDDIDQRLRRSMMVIDQYREEDQDSEELALVYEDLQDAVVLVNALLERAELREDYEMLIYARGWLVRVYDEIADMRDYRSDSAIPGDSDRDHSDDLDNQALPEYLRPLPDNESGMTAEERAENRRVNETRNNAANALGDLDDITGETP